jgi:hypothetical protein
LSIFLTINQAAIKETVTVTVDTSVNLIIPNKNATMMPNQVATIGHFFVSK